MKRRGRKEEGEANLFCIPAIPEQHRTRGPGISAHWDQMKPGRPLTPLECPPPLKPALLLLNQVWVKICVRRRRADVPASGLVGLCEALSLVGLFPSTDVQTKALKIKASSSGCETKRRLSLRK